MAKKTIKSTREQMYREIIEKEGRKWDDSNVLAFAFLSDTGPEYFHYELMLADPRPDYYLFDIMGEIAQVVAPKDAENDAIIVQLAESCGGKKRTTNLL